MRKADAGPVIGKGLVRCQRTPDALARAWNARKTYHTGDRAYLDGRVYEALWYTKGQEPGASPYGAWSTYTACGVSHATVQEWAADRVYTTGDKVRYEGKTYIARWWTRNQAPGAPWGPWRA